MNQQQQLSPERLAEAVTRKPIPGYPGYEADSLGNIWGVGKSGRWRNDHILSVHLETKGYWRVHLFYAGKIVKRLAHILVARAFHGIPLPGFQVRHLDGVRTNNVPDNLAWGTNQENVNDRQKHGTTARGSRVGNAKLDEQTVAQIKNKIATGGKMRTLAREYGVSARTISKIRDSATWAHVIEG